MADSYVCSGAMMRCTMGTSIAKLTVLPTRTVDLTGQPMANISDHKQMLNIPPFGLCRSMAYPPTAAAHGTPTPCMPNTPAPWFVGKMDYLIKGQPALLKSCKCQCMWGGTISLVTDGQVGEGVKYVQKRSKEEFVMGNKWSRDSETGKFININIDGAEEFDENNMDKHNNKAKGNLGEILAHDFLTNNPCIKYDLERTNEDHLPKRLDDIGHVGIDGVYKNASPPPQYVIIEVKFTTDADNSNEGLLSRTTDGSRQMSTRWISNRKRIYKFVSPDEAAKIEEGLKKDDFKVAHRVLIRVTPHSANNNNNDATSFNLENNGKRYDVMAYQLENKDGSDKEVIIKGPWPPK